MACISGESACADTLVFFGQNEVGSTCQWGFLDSIISCLENDGDIAYDLIVYSQKIRRNINKAKNSCRISNYVCTHEDNIFSLHLHARR